MLFSAFVLLVAVAGSGGVGAFPAMLSLASPSNSTVNGTNPDGTPSINPPPNVPFIPLSSLPCPKSIDFTNLYAFNIKNSLPYSVDVFYQLNDCADIFTGISLMPGTIISATSVAVNELYYVRATSGKIGTGSVLMALIFTADFSNKTWDLTPDQYGKIYSHEGQAASGSGGNVAAIAGGVSAGLILLIAVGLLLFVMHRRNKRDTSRTLTSPKTESPSPSSPRSSLGSRSFRTRSNYSSNRGYSSGGGSVMPPWTGSRLVTGDDFRKSRPGSEDPFSISTVDEPVKRSSLNWWSRDPTVTLARGKSALNPEPESVSTTAKRRPSIVTEDALVAGGRFRIVHRHKAALEDELTLWPGDQVTLVETYGDGWCLVRVQRSRRAHEGASAVNDEGVIPTGILSAADVTLPRGKTGQPEDSYDDTPQPEPKKRVKSLTRPESIVLFKNSGRDISKFVQ